MKDSEFEHKLSNRQKSKRISKKSQFWCPRCDMSLIGRYGKCEVCGFRNKKTHK